MKSVGVISGSGLPLRRSDVDTDQIIPADWLKRVERTGFDKGLFATWRDDRDFVLNDERFSRASVLVAGPAFGVGSSLRARRLGHPAIRLRRRDRPELLRHLPQQLHEERPGAGGVTCPDRRADLGRHRRRSGTTIVVDVERRVVEVPAIGLVEAFPIDDSTRHRLLEGLDDIGITLAHAVAIDAFEATRPPWLGSS